jgi:hypothetical protein
MLWARLLAYVTEPVNQELLLRNEYLAAENRILRGQIKGRLLLSEGEKGTLAEIAHRLGRKAGLRKPSTQSLSKNASRRCFPASSPALRCCSHPSASMD